MRQRLRRNSAAVLLGVSIARVAARNALQLLLRPRVAQLRTLREEAHSAASLVVRLPFQYCLMRYTITLIVWAPRWRRSGCVEYAMARPLRLALTSPRLVDGARPSLSASTAEDARPRAFVAVTRRKLSYAQHDMVTYSAPCETRYRVQRSLL